VAQPQTAPGPPAEETPAAYLAPYGRMLTIRLFEREMHRLFLEGHVHGTTHLSSG
jgi:TPP-dependent pyruvate/acetoin dehydrogenase alpha subunit